MDRLPTRVRATVVAVVPVVRHYVLPLDITSSQVEYITLVCAHEVLIRSPHRSLNLDPLWKIFVISFLDNLSFSSHNFYNPVVDIATVEQRNNWTNSFQGIIIIISSSSFFLFIFVPVERSSCYNTVYTAWDRKQRGCHVGFGGTCGGEGTETVTDKGCGPGSFGKGVG